MSGLDDIRISVAGQRDDDAPSGNGWAVLHEIERLLTVLVEEGREHSIDLHGLPMTAGDRTVLEDVLGEGEVNVEVSALGPSLIRETAIRGVWWVTHRNTEEDVVAEFIEVTHCPDIIRSQPDDIRDTLENLRMQLARHTDT